MKMALLNAGTHLTTCRKMESTAKLGKVLEDLFSRNQKALNSEELAGLSKSQ